MITVVFACAGDGARSLLAAALFESAADRAIARAVAVALRPEPALAAAVESLLREAGVRAAVAAPTLWTPDAERGAHRVVVFDEDPAAPVYGPRRRVVCWPVRAPDTTSPEQLRATRDEIRRRVRAMVAEAGWSVGTWV